MRIKNLCAQFLGNFAVSLDEIQYVVTTCWFVEANTKLVMHKYYSTERPLLT